MLAKNSLNPFVSVIVPVSHEDLKHLRTCMMPLQNQTYHKNKYEIIVISNAQNSHIEALTRYRNVVISEEKTEGSYAARNKGISIAKGRILAFTDADCICASNWIENGVKNFLKIPNCGLVAGKIKIISPIPNKLTAHQYLTFEGFQQKKFIKEKKYGVTANIFTSKKIMNRVGLFDPDLKSGGDLEWGNRVYNSGYKLIYSDDVLVEHPSRKKLIEILRHEIRIANGVHYLKKTSSAKYLRNPPLLDNISNILFENRLEAKEKIKVLLIKFLNRLVNILERTRLYLNELQKQK